jgi:hypothetical protein
VTLPILTLDELTLAPRHGYVFQRAWLQPYESVVGMLWKFAHMNRLPGHLVMSQLCDHSIDPYQAAHLPMSMFKGSRDCWNIATRPAQQPWSCHERYEQSLPVLPELHKRRVSQPPVPATAPCAMSGPW